jgi:hypothetical protein
MALANISDTLIVAVAQLFDDSQSSRHPSHSELDFHIRRAGLEDGDPKCQGQTFGKTKRVRSTLSWALEHDPDAGGKLVCALLELVRGHGGFRTSSENYAGQEAIENLHAAFDSEGYELLPNGQLRPKLLDNLSGTALTEALKIYVRRAKCGAEDAALVTGTGKDLLEATCAHILCERYGQYATTSNFPTLLGQVFVDLGLATPQNPPQAGESPTKRMERALYELACSTNQLRNTQGTGHGRPWLPAVTDTQAKSAIETMGVIAEQLLSLHQGGQ